MSSRIHLIETVSDLIRRVPGLGDYISSVPESEPTQEQMEQILAQQENDQSAYENITRQLQTDYEESVARSLEIDESLQQNHPEPQIPSPEDVQQIWDLLPLLAPAPHFTLHQSDQYKSLLFSGNDSAFPIYYTDRNLMELDNAWDYHFPNTEVGIWGVSEVGSRLEEDGREITPRFHPCHHFPVQYALYPGARGTLDRAIRSVLLSKFGWDSRAALCDWLDRIHIVKGLTLPEHIIHRSDFEELQAQAEDLFPQPPSVVSGNSITIDSNAVYDSTGTITVPSQNTLSSGEGVYYQFSYTGGNDTWSQSPRSWYSYSNTRVKYPKHVLFLMSLSSALRELNRGEDGRRRVISDLTSL